MKAGLSNEQRFIVEVDSFEFIAQDVDKTRRALADWLAALNADLQASRLACAGLTEQSGLALQANAIDTVLRNGMHAWSRQWSSLDAARALADTFDDKVLLLVFGKFNAGKSSFCNFMAERFAAHGKTVRHFHLDAGRIVQTPERFEEGTTETTARLQGVCLGEKLVLLDTPGLHSATPENAALTRRFTESADGVLWLTSSTSPGQVQELDELGRELHRNKPLLPVVTRSDMYDEDEVDGEIRKFLCNKTAQNRAEQEADIKTRAEQKLRAMGVDAALLKTPISISAHMAREQGHTPAAMIEAGFERLYAALLAIAGPALFYKRRKLAEVWLHHLEENVLGLLCREVSPLLAALNASSQAALARLERQREQIVGAVWRSVVPALPALLETHAATRDAAAIRNSLSDSVFDAFCREASGQLADYAVEPDASLARIQLDDDAGFEDLVVDCSGEVSDICQVAGVDYPHLYAALETAIHKNLLRLSSDAAEQCRASITRLMDAATCVKDALRLHERDLLDIKRALRTESA
ncbi:GTP1/OBG protein [Burkholderia sp. lig30]|jgi:predicted GTPase|uniref:GTPase n=1 Tax=Burkholderia sp. lig30 TaxID=1192124 RepID=UPI0004611E64|nr:GTPase [Burkholderia sp. lig30]KDB07227.1 GTP1/OBG protein [Burkholderia sp. lig30]